MSKSAGKCSKVLVNTQHVAKLRQIVTSVSRCGNWNSHTLLEGMWKGAAAKGTNFTFPPRAKLPDESQQDPAIAPLQAAKRNKNICSHQDWNTKVCRSISVRAVPQTTQRQSSEKWMNKTSSGYNGISVGSRKARTTDTDYDIELLKYFSKWRKPGTKGHLLRCMISFITQVHRNKID